MGVGDGQGGLACCDSWGHKESDTIEWLNWTEESDTIEWLNWTELNVYKCSMYFYKDHIVIYIGSSLFYFASQLIFVFLHNFFVYSNC